MEGVKNLAAVGGWDEGLGPLVSESSSTPLNRAGQRVVLASLAALVSTQLRCEAAIAT